MFSEDNGTGFFAKVKSVFTSVEKSEKEETNQTFLTQEESFEASVSDTENDIPATFYTPTSRVSDESVTEKEIPLRTVEVTAPSYSLPNEKDLDIRFATKFIGAGGKFIFCENIKEAIDNLRMLKMDQGWSHV